MFNSLDNEMTICRRRAGLPVKEVRWCDSVCVCVCVRTECTVYPTKLLIFDILNKIIARTTTNNIRRS